MNNESIAAAAVGIQQAQASQQIAIAAMKSNFAAQQSMADSIASSSGRVGAVQDSSVAVLQSGRILDSHA